MIGEQIAKYRKQKKLTQEQLGEALGVSNRTVSKWEAGTSLPGVDAIPDIARALGITLDMLFGVEEPVKTEDIAGIVKKAVRDVIEDVLPDVIEEAMNDVVPAALSSAAQDSQTYKLLIFGKDGKSSARCDGRLYIGRANPDKWYLYARDFNDSCVLGKYDTREEAEADLKKVFDAYTAKQTMIRL